MIEAVNGLDQIPTISTQDEVTHYFYARDALSGMNLNPFAGKVVIVSHMEQRAEPISENIWYSKLEIEIPSVPVGLCTTTEGVRLYISLV